KDCTSTYEDSGYLSSGTLNVTFDLGDGDWDDIDDENLVQASEISYDMIPAKDCSTRIDYSAAGRPCEESTPICTQFSQSQTVSSINAGPQVSPSVSHIPDKRPLPYWSQPEEGAKTSTEMYAQRMSPSFPKHKSSHKATFKGRFDFFSKPNALEHEPETAGRLHGKDDSSEVEAFLGIFDGIF
ncbi:hypothetical protein JZ751_009161, partial [Albula glossodonta]